jgi:hypothetical protein
MGCETDALVPGADVVVSGYGISNNGGPEGAKRWVANQVAYTQDSRVFFDPMSTCNGDSGGPTYLQVDDGSWRVLGTTTGGIECGMLGQSEMIHVFVPWIEADSGVDVTPCHDADGEWAPTAACADVPAEPDQSHGSWADGCAGPLVDPVDTCEPAEDTGGIESTDGGESGQAGDDVEPDPDDDDSADGLPADDEGDASGDDGDDTAEPQTPGTLGEPPPDEAGCACTAVPAARTGFAGLLLVLALRGRANSARARPRAS